MKLEARRQTVLEYTKIIIFNLKCHIILNAGATVEISKPRADNKMTYGHKGCNFCIASYKLGSLELISRKRVGTK